MLTKIETQVPCERIPFSVQELPQAQAERDFADDRQLSVVLRCQKGLFRTSPRPHQPAREREAKPTERTPRPAAGGRATDHKRDAVERGKLAVVQHEGEFRGFVTIVLGRHEKPEDTLDNLSRHVRKITGQPLDYYAVFVSDVETQGHIHAVCRCRPSDATWLALAAYADPKQRQKRSTATKGRPVDLRPVDDARGGLCGLLRYLHCARNASPSRLKSGQASIHKSRGLSRLGRALTTEQAQDARQRLAAYQAARRAKAHSPAQVHSQRPKVYVTTYTSARQSSTRVSRS